MSVFGNWLTSLPPSPIILVMPKPYAPPAPGNSRKAAKIRRQLKQKKSYHRGDDTRRGA